MTKKSEVALALVGVILVAVMILFIWAIQNKKITPFAGTIHSASLSVSPAVGTLNLNQEYTAEILIDSQDLQSSGAELLINYDPAAIEIIDQDRDIEGVQIAATNLFPVVFENIVDPENRTIRFSVVKERNNEPVFINAPRVLASIIFRPIKAIDSTQFNFDFAKGKTSDCNVFQYSAGVEQDVLFGAGNGDYTIIDNS